MYTALTIAGSDSSGGAGIQADIKTMSAHGVYAMSAITALTAQNTTGVYNIMEVTPVFLCDQLDAVFTDIYPDAIKIGMLSGTAIMEAVAKKLKEYKAKNIVLDPVMVATSGAALMKADSTEYMIKELFPLASIITPNIPEAEVIAGMDIKTKEDMEAAGNKIYSSISGGNTAVLVKGGHSINDANDLLIIDGKNIWIDGKRVDNPNTHGTGCTLSSAIASNLAMGRDIESSVRNAKEYIYGALAAGLDLGKGSGPINHLYKMI